LYEGICILERGKKNEKIKQNIIIGNKFI